MTVVVSTPRKVAAAVTANGYLGQGRHTPVNAGSGNVTMTLPTGAPEGTEISVEKVDASTNTVSITGNVRGTAATTVTLSWQYESITFQADASGSWWPTAGHKTKSALDAAYLRTAPGALGRFCGVVTALPTSGQQPNDWYIVVPSS